MYRMALSIHSGLIRSNVEEAQQLGAKVFPHCEVVAIQTHGGKYPGIAGERPTDRRRISDQTADSSSMLPGVWAGKMARMAGASLEIVFSKGSLIVLNQRLVNTVINRCRLPSNGDIFVPHGPALILGTTSQTTEEIEDPSADESEVDLLLSEGEKLLPEFIPQGPFGPMPG